MTRKTALAIVALIYLCNFSIAYGKDVVIHSSNGNNGLELVNLEPPQVTYDEELNELTVYFGSSSTIDLECDDGTGNHIISYMVNTIRVTYDAMGNLI